jgi:hypothetical protein
VVEAEEERRGVAYTLRDQGRAVTPKSPASRSGHFTTVYSGFSRYVAATAGPTMITPTAWQESGSADMTYDRTVYLDELAGLVRQIDERIDDETRLLVQRLITLLAECHGHVGASIGRPIGKATPADRRPMTGHEARIGEPHCDGQNHPQRAVRGPLSRPGAFVSPPEAARER